MSKNVGTSAPLTLAQRYAGFNSVFWLWAGGNVLLTNFIAGSVFATGVGFVGLLVLSFAGFCLGFAFCSWNSQRSARYGIDEIVSLRPAFGHRGSNPMQLGLTAQIGDSRALLSPVTQQLDTGLGGVIRSHLTVAPVENCPVRCRLR